MSHHYPKSFTKDNVLVIAGQVLSSITGLILIPIVIKVAGVTIYGGFVLLSSLLGIVFGISSFGAGFRAQRFLPATEERVVRQKLFYPQFFFHMFSILFLSLLLVLLSRQINTYIFKNAFSYSAIMIPLYLFCYFLYAQSSMYFRYTSRLHYMVVTGISYSYLYIGFILLFFYGYRIININVLVLSQTLSAFLVAVFCFLVIFKDIGINFFFYRIKELIVDIKIGFPLVLNFIVDFILAGSDRYFIAFFLTVSAVGYYNPGYVIGSLMIFIPKAMGCAMPQLLSKAVDKGSEYEAQRMLNYAIKIFLLLTIPFIFGSMVLSKQILTLLANRDVAENAYLIVPIVALGTLFYGLNIILANALFVRMKTYAIFKMNLLASVFNLLANLILFYFFKNIIVAATTTFLSYFIAFIYVYKIVKKNWPVDFHRVAILKFILASLFMGGLLFWMVFNLKAPNTVIALISELVLGTVVYFGVLLGLKTFSAKELVFVKRCVYR